MLVCACKLLVSRNAHLSLCPWPRGVCKLAGWCCNGPPRPADTNCARAGGPDAAARLLPARPHHELHTGSAASHCADRLPACFPHTDDSSRASHLGPSSCLATLRGRTCTDSEDLSARRHLWASLQQPTNAGRDAGVTQGDAGQPSALAGLAGAHSGGAADLVLSVASDRRQFRRVSVCARDVRATVAPGTPIACARPAGACQAA